jgi:hypothetical protein
VFPDPTDLCRGKTILFEVMSQGADDARAGGSDRDEEHGIHLILPEQTCQSMRHSLHSTEMRRSNLGVLNRHHAANNTLASRGARMGGWTCSSRAIGVFSLSTIWNPSIYDI